MDLRVQCCYNLNNHKSYIELEYIPLIKSMKNPSIFIDTWHIFEPSEIKQLKNVLYGGIELLNEKTKNSYLLLTHGLKGGG